MSDILGFVALGILVLVVIILAIGVNFLVWKDVIEEYAKWRLRCQLAKITRDAIDKKVRERESQKTLNH